VVSTGRLTPNNNKMGDRYLSKALEFLGFELMETVFAEGMDHNPKMIPEIIAKAKDQAAEAAREMAKKTVTI
jgi:FMN-dependent NADH-azoreductase